MRNQKIMRKKEDSRRIRTILLLLVLVIMVVLHTIVGSMAFEISSQLYRHHGDCSLALYKYSTEAATQRNGSFHCSSRRNGHGFEDYIRHTIPVRIISTPRSYTTATSSSFAKLSLTTVENSDNNELEGEFFSFTTQPQSSSSFSSATLNSAETTATATMMMIDLVGGDTYEMVEEAKDVLQVVSNFPLTVLIEDTESTSPVRLGNDATTTRNLSDSISTSTDTTSGISTTNGEKMKLVQAAVPSSTTSKASTIVVDSLVAPSVSKILKFAIPAIGVWLCGPILSLIDTSAVGILSGTTQQAALNPATAVTDYAALLIAFMYTGSTNLIAAAREKDYTTKAKGKIGLGDDALSATSPNHHLLIGALQLSTYVGLILGVSLIFFARVLLRTIIGNDSINPDVFAAAMKYVRIRALGMPAAAMIGTAQAACLGMQDIRSPLYVLLAAAVVNFIGDMVFVPCTNAWIGGAAGAAWATVFSQYAAVVLFVYWLQSKPTNSNNNQFVGGMKATNKDKTPMSIDTRQGSIVHNVKNATIKWFTDKVKLNNKKPADQRTAAITTTAPTDLSFSVRGLLENNLRKRDLLKFPPRSILTEFSPYVGPVTSTVIGRVSGYIAMSHVVSSSLGTFSMAAQQVIVSIFYCLCPVADSLSLTAQSFVPALSAKDSSKERAVALQETFLNFMKAGSLFGVVLAGIISCLPLLSGLFTPDPVVISLVNAVTPLLMIFFVVHGLMCASEGLLLAQKDLGFLGKMYAGFFFIVPFFMMSVKRAALSGATVGLTNVWTVFVSYQLFRTAVWVGRAGWIQNQTSKAATKASSIE